MSTKVVLSIGGLDPCGGAGILADIKTIDHFGVQGFGVATAITYQNESDFVGLEWLPIAQITAQLAPLIDPRYDIKAIKIGLIQSMEVLMELTDHLSRHVPGARIIWDPVIKASAGYGFHQSLDGELVRSIVERTFMVTPNMDEARVLAKALGLSQLQGYAGDCLVLIKGGHTDGDMAEDIIYQHGSMMTSLSGNRLLGKSIHGSGCVFASALASGLAMGCTLDRALAQAKEYVHQLLLTAESGLATHYKLKK